MSTIDLSRLATDPRKHYAGVRMQQGRVLTDDDFNEAAAIDAEELRRTRLHAIGVYGSPDAGFLPADFGVANGTLDFAISAGNLYLGGLRLEMTTPDRFVLQKDWLEFDAAVDGAAPPAEGQTRTDLVWIEAWQQPVTAVEDAELFEVALGGPDTTTRWRTMRRVRIATGVKDADSDCASAWGTLSASFTDGSIDAEMAVTSTATLAVTFTLSPAPGDLCSPPQSAGYLGAENQAIRVQMVDATHYTWGYDNAAPLYRVQASATGGLMVQLTLLNAPRDAMHWPLAGQVVEILPWSAALANGQRVAETAGLLCKVAVSYNPDDGTLQIDTPLPAGFGLQWQSRSDTADFFDGTAADQFFFMRVWNRGDDLASPAAIPVAQGALGHTGLQVAFNGGPLSAAMYWVIAARPAAPDVVVPWQLGLPAGAPPNGIRRWRAPLALVAWTTSGGVTTGTLVADCRPPFLPLTRMRNCCNVTVGDGSHSFGLFSSVQKAIDSLPATGGTVCVLPGTYHESVTIANRRNVTLHGCGPASRIVAPDNQGDDSTALRIFDSSDVAVETLAFEGGIQAVIEVQRSTVVRIADCLVQMRDFRQATSPWPALFVGGAAIEVEDNIVEIVPDDLHRIFHKTAEALRGPPSFAARGGIQLAGGCEHVRVAGNVVVGGTGNAITLGSILRVDIDDPNGTPGPDIDDPDPCAPCDPTDSGTPPDGGNGGVRYESAGDLYDITIADNVLTRHGGNGISVVRFFGPLAQGGLTLVTVHGLRIDCNRITRCLQRDVAEAPVALQLLLGYGGISLAFVTELEIESNLIAGNGLDWISPVCGVFALAVEGLRIEHNQIYANGVPGDEPADSAHPGVRAGVHIWLALALQAPSTKSSTGFGGNPASFEHASSLATSTTRVRVGTGPLRVHGNRIEQPLGRALFMLGAGPMHVTDNRLLSEGVALRVTDPIARTVLIGNFGVSREWTPGLLVTLLYLIIVRVIKGSASDQVLKLICTLSTLSRAMVGIWPKLPTGKLLFNDNQVSFLMQAAPRGLDIASALLLSLDDVSASDNQFEYHTTTRRFVLADLLAAGMSVRTDDNRLAETWGRALRSVLSFALMNTAADNQSTHCVQALGLQRAVHHNLVLAQAFCANACGDPQTLIGHMVLNAQAVAAHP